jgi:hypothetical protein
VYLTATKQIKRVGVFPRTPNESGRRKRETRREGAQRGFKRSSELWPSSAQEQGMLLGREGQGAGQERERVSVRGAMNATLQVGNCPCAEASAGCQSLLRET